MAFSFSLSPVIAEDNTKKNSNSDLRKPVHAANIKIAKKVFDPLAIKEMEKKVNPAKSPGKNKKPSPIYDGSATGILGDVTTGEKYAIIIGICNYPGETSNDLCTSDGDSLRMYKALTTIYGYSQANIYLLKDMGGTTGLNLGNKAYEIPTRNNILDAIEDIKNLATSPEDEVVFFYSGHGTTGNADDGDNEYLDEGIFVWGTGDDTAGDTTYIWDGELKTAFADFATSRIVFIFDTCKAGGMNDLAGAGRVISMATKEVKSAYVYSSDLFNLRIDEMEDVDGDGIADGEGVFSRLFVNYGMLQGFADVHDYIEIGGNEPATVEEAFDYAKEAIFSIYRRQRPVISDEFVNDLFL